MTFDLFKSRARKSGRRVKFECDRRRDRPYVVVQFRFGDGFEIPYDEGDVAKPERYLGSLWADLRRISPEVRLRRLYDAMSRDEFQKFIDRARENDPSFRKLPSFFEFFQLLAPGGVDDPHFCRLAMRLTRDKGRVRDAYVEIPAPLPAVNYSSEPGFNGDAVIDKQWHVHAPPATVNAQGGIDAVGAWDLAPYYDGSTVRFVDIERGWALDHEDLQLQVRLQNEPLYGINSSSDAYHGTQVLGVLVGTDGNGKGIVGLAPKAEPHIASCIASGGDFNHEAPCQAVLSVLRPGDVAVIEAQVQDPATRMWVPAEWLPSNFNLIKCLTANQIIVIEAGGNGDENGYHVDFDQTWPNADDSGAIIVSAAWMGDPVYGPAAIPDYAPRGQRVDCFAWGQGIPTCWIQNGRRDEYDNYFDGTSAATAIVAGAAILLQDAARKRNNGTGAYIQPAAMRQIMKDPRFTMASPGPALIGRMPDIGQLINALNSGAFPGV